MKYLIRISTKVEVLENNDCISDELLFIKFDIRFMV